MKNFRIAVIGNPNSGKSTLFNVLTGERVETGNWPGVTVEKKEGILSFVGLEDTKISLIDLPGVYGLSISLEDDTSGALDEKIACDYLLTEKVDLIINVLDATNLERNLFLTMQLADLDCPLLLAVNMYDLSSKKKMEIDFAKLEKIIGYRAVAISAKKQKGIDNLKDAILKFVRGEYPENFHLRETKEKLYSFEILSLLNNATALFDKQRNARFFATKAVSSLVSLENYNPSVAAKVKNLVRDKKDLDLAFADANCTLAHSIMNEVVSFKGEISKNKSDFVDKIILNKYLSIPIFIGVMYFVFFFSINFGEMLQGYLQIFIDNYFLTVVSAVLDKFYLSPILYTVIVDGFIKGVVTVLLFLPILFSVYLVIGFLENSGYIARAVFIVDRIMRFLSLPGRAFLPMLLGFGCSVPAVLSTRSLEKPRDRVLTAMMVPFMSCSAKFAIYAIFVTAFFPKNGTNVMFLLYFLGIGFAFFTGCFLKNTVLKGEPSSLMMELPCYHIPSLKIIFQQTFLHIKSFLFKATQIIVPFCILLSFLNAPVRHWMVEERDSSATLIEQIGQKMVPAFAPMGISEDNWQAVVGLITGVAAKETVVSTLNTLYAHGDANKDTKSVFSNMVNKFSQKGSAFAYLLFLLLYCPCIPTLATLWKEFGKKWALFSMFWNTLLAYGVATIYYQACNFIGNEAKASIAILSVLAFFVLFFWVLKKGKFLKYGI